MRRLSSRAPQERAEEGEHGRHRDQCAGSILDEHLAEVLHRANRARTPFLDDGVPAGLPDRRERREPRTLVLGIEPGDRIMLCSDGVAVQLAKIEEQYPGKLRARLASLLRDTPEHAAPKLRELLGPGDDDMLMVLAPGEEPGVDGEPQHFLVRHRTTNPPASRPTT